MHALHANDLLHDIHGIEPCGRPLAERAPDRAYRNYRTRSQIFSEHFRPSPPFLNDISDSVEVRACSADKMYLVPFQ